MSLTLFLDVVQHGHRGHEINHFACGQQVQVGTAVFPSVSVTVCEIGLRNDFKNSYSPFGIISANDYYVVKNIIIIQKYYKDLMSSLVYHSITELIRFFLSKFHLKNYQRNAFGLHFFFFIFTTYGATIYYV